MPGLGNAHQRTDRHDQGKEAQVVQCLDAVCHKRAIHHKAAAQDGHHRQDVPHKGLAPLGMGHDRDKHGNIAGIQGDNGQFIGFPIEERGAHAVDEEKMPVGVPQQRDDDAEPGGIRSHIGLFIHMGKEPRRDALSADAQRVGPAGAAHHQAIGSTQAADDDEHKDDGAGGWAKQIAEGFFREHIPCCHHLGGTHAAGKAHEVGHVDNDHNERTKGQRQREVLFGIAQLAVNGGCNDPALISEGKGHNGAHQAAALGGYLGAGRGKGLHGEAIGKAGDGARNGHQNKGDKLDNGSGDLQLAGQPGSIGIDEAIRQQDAEADPVMGHARYRKAKQNGRILGGDPAQRAGDGGIIDQRHEPGHIVGVAAAQRRLGVIYHAIDLLVPGGQIGEHKGADEHNGAHDADGEQTAAHIAVIIGQHLGGLKKDATADDDAHDHGNGGKQAIAFLHAVFHDKTLFLTGCHTNYGNFSPYFYYCM